MRFCVIACVIFGCRSVPIEDTATLGPGLGSTHVVGNRSIEALRANSAPPAAAQRLAVASDQLEAAGLAPDTARVVTALRALADAVELVAADQSEALAQLRRATDNLARDNSGTARDVRLALGAATVALASVTAPADDHARFVTALEALRHETAVIDPSQSLHDQYAHVEAALRASTRAVAAAAGAQPGPASEAIVCR